MSKLLPGSMPIRFMRAMIGSSVICGGFTFMTSAAYAKYLSADIVSTWTLGGVFMSTDGSTVAVTASAVFPQRESGVIL
jgi:hypothetical protein